MQAKNTTRRRTVRNTELARMVQGLRKSLAEQGDEISQMELAKRLHANRSQVVKWESGDETPSTDRIMQMACLAPTIEQKMAFWREAIPELDALRSVIYREAFSRDAMPSDTRAVHVINEFGLGQDGVPFAKEESAGDLHISAGSIAMAGDPVAMVIQPALLRYGNSALPVPMSVGDIVILDRAQTNPRYFANYGSVSRKMVAILLPRLPISFGVTGPQFMPDEALHEQGLDASFLDILRDFAHPVVMFGFLSDQRESDAPPTGVASLLSNEGQAAINRFRLEFTSGQGFRIPMTDWVEKSLPGDVGDPLLYKASILGRVIGWIGQAQL
jgi:transcriptional regulator with XRE-family HTH domain